jgi:hypothetical protein
VILFVKVSLSFGWTKSKTQKILDQTMHKLTLSIYVILYKKLSLVYFSNPTIAICNRIQIFDQKIIFEHGCLH